MKTISKQKCFAEIEFCSSVYTPIKVELASEQMFFKNMFDFQAFVNRP